MLANGVIESVHFDAYVPKRVRRAATSTSFKLRHVPIRELTRRAAARSSAARGTCSCRSPEMKAIQAYFREQEREPTDVELETIAQTWSEHCVHKTLKSAVEVDATRPGKIAARATGT